jgi:hypothetical protein
MQRCFTTRHNTGSEFSAVLYKLKKHPDYVDLSPQEKSDKRIEEVVEKLNR